MSVLSWDAKFSVVTWPRDSVRKKDEKRLLLMIVFLAHACQPICSNFFMFNRVRRLFFFSEEILSFKTLAGDTLMTCVKIASYSIQSYHIIIWKNMQSLWCIKKKTFISVKDKILSLTTTKLMKHIRNIFFLSI